MNKHAKNDFDAIEDHISIDELRGVSGGVGITKGEHGDMMDHDAAGLHEVNHTNLHVNTPHIGNGAGEHRHPGGFAPPASAPAHTVADELKNIAQGHGTEQPAQPAHHDVKMSSAAQAELKSFTEGHMPSPFGGHGSPVPHGGQFEDRAGIVMGDQVGPFAGHNGLGQISSEATKGVEQLAAGAVHAASDLGAAATHAASDVAKDVGQAVSGAAHEAGQALSGAEHVAEQAAHEVEQTASHAASAVKQFFQGW